MRRGVTTHTSWGHEHFRYLLAEIWSGRLGAAVTDV